MSAKVNKVQVGQKDKLLTRFQKHDKIILFMETFNIPRIIRALQEKNITVFQTVDFARLFHVKTDDTLYKKLSRLENQGIVKKIIKGKYFFALARPSDFLIANFLVVPSYVSLESALSFHGVITGFPYQITSITPKNTCRFEIDGKEFEFSTIRPDLFCGFEKKDNFLIAAPEKAVFDYLWFAFKGRRSPAIDEFDLTEINRYKLMAFCKIAKHEKFNHFVKKLKII